MHSPFSSIFGLHHLLKNFFILFICSDTQNKKERKMNAAMFTGSTYRCLHALPEKTEKSLAVSGWLPKKKKKAPTAMNKFQLWYRISIYHLSLMEEFNAVNIFLSDFTG